MQKEIGIKINALRNSKNFTLKDLSEKTNLSVSFLSQAERGLTSIAIVSLKKIAQALDTDVTYFFDPPKNNRNVIVRSYEQEVFRMEDSEFIYFNLGSEHQNKSFDPMLVTLLPSKNSLEEIIPYSHEGEEFIYVLEGVCTILLEDKSYELYPGDSAHFPSTLKHNWANVTNKLVKILAVNSPSII